MDLAKSDEIDLIFTLDKKIYSSQWMCTAERVEDTIFVTSDRVFAQKSNIHLISILQKRHFFSQKRERPIDMTGADAGRKRD